MVEINRTINAFLVFRPWKMANKRDVIMPFYPTKMDKKKKTKRQQKPTAKGKERPLPRLTPSAPAAGLLPEQRGSFI